MKKILLIILTLSCIGLRAQDNPSLEYLNVECYDVSHLWLTEYPIRHEAEEFTRWEPIGYFGDNYQRFYIHFNSAIRNPDNKSEYLIYGRNKQKENISEIQGTIRIKRAGVFENNDQVGIREGIISGTYTFYEDQKKKGTGKLHGTFESYIMIINSEIHYSTINWFADGFSNNQFEGSWTSYTTGVEKVCNWGDYRIPNRQGFDIGAGQMGVHPDFVNNGWESFELATFPIANSDEHRKQIEAAKKKEEVEWWK